MITGTSAGGLVAALAATRTDAELKAMLTPELADKITACEESFRQWIRRFWKTGARFDSVDWARKVNIPPQKQIQCLMRNLVLLLHSWLAHIPGSLPEDWPNIERLCDSG